MADMDTLEAKAPHNSFDVRFTDATPIPFDCDPMSCDAVPRVPLGHISTLSSCCLELSGTWDRRMHRLETRLSILPRLAHREYRGETHAVLQHRLRDSSPCRAHVLGLSVFTPWKTALRICHMSCVDAIDSLRRGHKGTTRFRAGTAKQAKCTSKRLDSTKYENQKR